MKQGETKSGTTSESPENGKGDQGSNTAVGSKSASGAGWPSMPTATGGRQDTAENKQKTESLLEKFFVDQLKDMYYAEQHIIKALPKLEESATTEELKDAFSDHLHQTKKHVKRIEKVFNLLGKKPEGKKCEAIEGLSKEAETIIKETKDGTMTRDAALIIAAQKVEHYEIATYGGLVQLALTMGLDEAADLLDTTLMEEEETDRQLTEIAEGYINIEAEEETNYSWKSDATQNGL